MTTRNQAGLTRQVIVETALRLLDEVGLDGLTVRRLATELGVKSPALYWHFRNKQELLDGMAELVQQPGKMGGPRAGESWQRWLLRRAWERRRSLLAHRDGARLIAATMPSPATIRMFDEELVALVGCGFTPVLALRTIGSVSHYITGFVLQQQSGADPARMATRPPELLLEAVRDGGDPLGDEAFEHGLRLLIDGTAAALASR